MSYTDITHSICQVQRMGMVGTVRVRPDMTIEEVRETAAHATKPHREVCVCACVCMRVRPHVRGFNCRLTST